MIDVNMFFDNTPDRVLEHFKNKIPKTLDIDKIRFDAYQRTFIVSAINEINTLEKMHSVLYKAYEKGLSFDSVKNELLNIAGSLGSHHLKTIFNTNMRQAYAMSRYETQLKGDKPYLRYVAVGDYKTRPEHQALHNTVLPVDDPAWAESLYPPKGFNCRCKVQSVSEEEAQKYGVGLKSPIPPVPKGFNFSLIQPRNALFKVLEDKVNSLHSDIKNRAKTIMNNAYKSTQEHTKRYETIKERFNHHQNIMKEQKMSAEEYTNFINNMVGNFSDEEKKIREQNLIKLCEYKGKGVFIDEYQIANHFYHPNIGAMDYSLVPQILKGSYKKGNKKNSIVYKKMLGFNYKLVIKDVNGKIYVESLTKDSD
ncbi:phage head morphogenesis protein [Campylobacter sp. RM12637]|uniref:phage head morphogenesis protein n=1 Tax=Campylobacter sp. RM12637 TaxID=2735734 RepID=UPI003015213D|nr:minor capsid protein [Campylobacter sp. RM12637]